MSASSSLRPRNLASPPDNLFALEACSLEEAACRSNAGCALCLDGDGETWVAERDECLSDVWAIVIDGDACELHATSACCLSQIPGYNCIEIDEYVEYAECFAGHVNGQECPDFLSSCSERTPSPTPAPVRIPSPETSASGLSTSTGWSISLPTPVPVDIPHAVNQYACPPHIDRRRVVQPVDTPPAPALLDLLPQAISTPASSTSIGGVDTPSGSMCSDGVPGILVGDACCDPGCSQCGGSECSTSGAAQGLGSSECCVNTILASGNTCGAAPCIVEGMSVATRHHASQAGIYRDLVPLERPPLFTAPYLSWQISSVRISTICGVRPVPAFCHRNILFPPPRSLPLKKRRRVYLLVLRFLRNLCPQRASLREPGGVH